ncbi:hypothetical protein HYX58_02435 [Candidatus Dependentiae bacterium]|nr:hypothetical protein [Candidatus Dependentiae bacterium]
MKHHGVWTKKASVVSIVILSLATLSASAMDQAAEITREEMAERGQTVSYDINAIMSAIKHNAKSITDSDMVKRAKEFVKPVSAQSEPAPKVIVDTVPEITVQAEVTLPSNESRWKLPKFDTVSFAPLLENQAVLYGIGAVGILTVGTVTYVLYKNGVFTKIATIAKKYPWCTAAVTGTAAIAAAAGVLYYKGADAQTVMNFFSNLKKHLVNAPQTFSDSVKKMVKNI